VYKVERQQKPLALGKTRRHTLSNTRRVIEWIVEAAKPAKCLETNLYARATAQSADLQATDRDAKIFEYLLSAIRPKVVLVHGRDAAQHVEAMCGVHLEINTSAAIPLESAIVHVTAVPHLSRGWSKTRAKAVGEQLREASKSVGLTMRCSRAPLAAGA